MKQNNDYSLQAIHLKLINTSIHMYVCQCTRNATQYCQSGGND